MALVTMLGASIALSAPPTFAADRAENLLRELSEAPGPSGFEEPVRAIMAREMKPLAKLSYDGMGSVIAQHGAAGPRIMLDAHMDELGGMVRRVTPEGFVTMQMLGGWLDMALPGQRWVILTARGLVKAVSGIRDVHVTPPDERTRPFSRDNLYLDIGARNAADAAGLGIEPGDPVAPDVAFEELANGRYVGKAWDDRVGCAVVVDMAGDQPATHPDETNGRLGGGPDVLLYDSSAQPNRKLVAFLKDTARSLGVPVQYDLVAGYGDDSAEIQKTATGVPTVNIGVPVRYMHVHNGVIDRADFDATVALVVGMVKRLDAAAVTRIRDFAPLGG